MTLLTEFTLTDLGWSDHFARQLAPGDADLVPARVSEIHRDRLRALSAAGPVSLFPSEAAGNYAVGDWILYTGERAIRRLDPKTDLTRKAAGRVAYSQRIAANVDTLGIVTSCNADFNIARLERYLALAASAGCLPLIILTKADKTGDAADYLGQAHALSPLASAIAINAKDPDDVARLAPWIRGGQTLALLGSSGVGKTTIRNALTGESKATQGIREDDAKGRHTTTYRSLVRLPQGGWLIDTPGMRELQLTDVEDGIEEVFDDVMELAAACKFRDCAHEGEPGCAVRAAIEDGRLDPARLDRYRKLQAEDRVNTETIAQKRARGRAFGKMVKNAKKVKKTR